MEAGGQAEVRAGEARAAEGPDHLRKRPRFAVDEEAELLLVDHGLPLRCRIIDLSLEGCRTRTRERYPAGLGVRVELIFRVNGIVFRFCGAVRWTDGLNSVGIQFVGVSARRIAELAEVLGEVQEDLAARAAREQAEKVAAEEQAAKEQAAAERARAAAEEQQAGQTFPEPYEPAAASRTGFEEEAEETIEGGRPVGQGEWRERRAHPRHEVHTSAAIFLVHTGFSQRGRILDLSVAGCRIHTDERFLLCIYTPVDTEFRLAGQPFRLGGVIHEIREGDRVGIRFLNMSSRQKEQLEQLIEDVKEIEEMRAAGKLRPPPAPSA